MEFDMALEPYLGEVIDQVQMLMGEDIPRKGDSFFDLNGIRKDFSENESVELTALESKNKLNLEGAFDFDSIESMLQKSENQSVEKKLIQFTKRNGISELTLIIKRETVMALLEANPALNNPLVQNFGPATTEGLSSEDYLEMMEFALGEESRQGIQDSRIIMTIQVEGLVLDQKGGKRINDSSVQYEIKLLDILMLNKTLTYSLQYR